MPKNEQARHVYKNIESGSVINIDINKHKIDQDIDKIDDTNGKNIYIMIL